MEKALFSSNSDEWKTPQELYKELNERFKFTLDPCSTEENHLCDKYYTKKKKTVFANHGRGRPCLLIHHTVGLNSGLRNVTLSTKQTAQQ